MKLVLELSAITNITNKTNLPNTEIHSINEESLPRGSLRCLIPLKDGNSLKVIVPISTLKVERENAWAMTVGYSKSNKLNYSTIFTALKDGWALKNSFTAKSRYIPKVLSYRNSKEPNYYVSVMGLSMGVSDYDQPFSLPHKYVAILDRIFYINEQFHKERGMELWNMLCGNGIFDQWNPSAPFNRLTGNFDVERGGEKEVKEPQILLLRVYELDKTIRVQNKHAHIDTITEDICDLKLKQPVIPYNPDDRFYSSFKGKFDFESIINLIRNSLEHFGILNEKKVNDTSLIEIPS
jgi:hypothetical protein